MVNSSSIGCEENGNRKASCIQTNSFHSETQSSSPITATSATQSRNDFMRTADINTLCKADAVEPTPSKTDLDGGMTITYNSVLFSGGLDGIETDKAKKSFFCSVPLEKVQTILSTYTSFRCDGDSVKISRKVLCLYCDRTFVNVNLRQKHIERCHSAKQLRRVSLRKHQNCFTSTPCIYCDKFSSTTHTLKELFEHLIRNHSNKYFGCLSCEDRYFDFSHLSDHNALHHNLRTLNQESHAVIGSTEETVRSKQKTKRENKLIVVNSRRLSGRLRSEIGEAKKSTNVKNLRNKKFSVKSSRIITKRSKRLQAKLNGSQQKKQVKDVEKKDKSSKYEQTFSTKLNDKSAKASLNSINPYPEFDTFFQVKKITDHSIDNLKISSLTFDDVFDKAFFNRIKCNIQENLLHHIDGKLFKNEESESRISNFEKISNSSQEVQNLNAENYGCELSLNAITPTTMLLSSQFGEDPESQIEYGSKPSKKKSQIKKDEIHYKYLTRRKYQASILERKENRDLSKLDMWTQYIIKNRQQKVLDDKKSPKEILDYFSGEEYKNLMKKEELNRILDRRGPFEDLKEEVSKKAALDKLNGETEIYINDDSLIEVGELLNDILNNVFELTKENGRSIQNCPQEITRTEEECVPEIPSYLNLRRTSSLSSDNVIDKSDKITLICSSQETENFELPSNTLRGKNEKIELTGEWARSRIYVCAACGLKLQNIKQFLEHKSTSHQYVWVQHYEFVGNQSELYRHLSIPVLGKVGVLEQHLQCKVWKRSDARQCTKCGKQCNSLGELHRHILECGGDWTWMLVRKKYKYRPFGAKSRRKRRGLVKRIYTQKTEPSEKKIYKKSFDIPRQKASDADTIQRMLANLPPKRTSRKIICLKDGFNTNRKKQGKPTKTSKFKCGKLIHGKGKEQNKNSGKRYKRVNKGQPKTYRRSLRCLNKVITSRILDTNSSLIRKQYKKKIKNEETKEAKNHVNKKSKIIERKRNEEPTVSSKKAINTSTDAANSSNEDKTPEKLKLKSKRSSPRIEKLLEFNCVRKTLIDSMNVKRFFPIKKKNKVENEKIPNEKKANTKRKAPEKNLDKKVSNEVSGDTKTIRLRKRKLDAKNIEPTVANKTKAKKKNIDKKAEILNKKRKLRNNPRVVVDNKVELSTTEVSNEQDNSPSLKSDSFLEESVVQNSETVESEESIKLIEDNEQCSTEAVPAVEDEKENKDNVQVTNEESLVVNIIPPVVTHAVADKVKKKMRRPTRGLNDCIAMLTNKLHKNLEESATNDVFNVMSAPSYQENIINKETEISQNILKVPLSDEHFDLKLPTVLNGQNLCESNQAKNVEVKEKEKSILDDINENVDEPPLLQICTEEPNVNDINESLDDESRVQDDVCTKEVLTDFIEKKPRRRSRKNCNPPILEKVGEIMPRNKTKKQPRNQTSKSSEFRIGKGLLSKTGKKTRKKKKKKMMNLEETTPKPFFQANSKSLSEKADDALLNEEVMSKENDVDQEQTTNFPLLNDSIPEPPAKSCSDSEDEIPLAIFLRDDQCSRSSLSRSSLQKSALKQNGSEHLSDIIKNAMENSEILNNNELLQSISSLEESKNTHFEDINYISCYEHDVTNEVFEIGVQGNASQIADLPQNYEKATEKLGLEDNKEKTALDDSLCEYYENATSNILETETEENNCNKEIVDEYRSTNLKSAILLLDEGTNDNKDEKVNDDNSSLLIDCNQRDTLSVNNECATHEPNLVKSNIEPDNTEILEKEDTVEENKSFSDPVIQEDYSTEESDSRYIDRISSNEFNESMMILESLKVKQVASKKDEVTNENKDTSINMNSNGFRKNGNSKRNKDRRKIIRNAKTKACELIFDEALQELTESERNINNIKNVLSKEDIIQENLDEKEELLEPLIKSVEISTENNSLQVVNEETNIDLNLLMMDETEESLTIRTSTDQECVANEKITNDLNNDSDSGKELRRSKRNSRKIASYNEIDLVDPLLDDIDGNKLISSIVQETTRKFLLDKPKSKSHSHKKTKNDSKEVKLSGDELFDLLKAKPNENVLIKPANSFLNNFDDLSNEFTNDNFDVLEDILEKSIAVIEENLAEKMVPAVIVNEPSSVDDEIDKEVLIEHTSDSESKTDSLTKKSQNNSNKSKPKKKSKSSKQRKYQRKLLGEEIENKLNTFEKSASLPNSNLPSDFDSASKESFNNNNVDNSNSQSSQVDSVQRAETDKSKVSYCEICNKFFSRVESLTKHKRTLTHISKLSELEAMEAALKAKQDQVIENDELIEESEITSESRRNLNLLDILETIETTGCKETSPPFSVDINNANLKLADIINDVLNKPVMKKCTDQHNFSDIIVHNGNVVQSEIKRCKSLAERKSFESENIPIPDTHIKTVDYFEPEIANTAGTILEKQITLLENIIENRSNLSYIDDLTIASSHSESENIASNELSMNFPRQDDSIHAYPDQCGLENNLMKSNIEEESFLKPTQYEEISEDSNLRNYDEQKSRKVLNRDEELFLECCSLLKSGSEISEYSKRSAQVSKDLGNLEMKQCDEPEWLENDCLSQKENSKDIECFSDNSGITTPLGDNFSPDESNSVTISSQWDMNNSSMLLKTADCEREFGVENQSFTFDKVFSNEEQNEDSFSSGRNSDDEQQITVSSFDGVIEDVAKFDLNSANIDVEDKQLSPEQSLDDDRGNGKIGELNNTSPVDNKKMLTKGAMKVFEGLKVSIPTEELNMAKILTYSPPIKKISLNGTEFEDLKTVESDDMEPPIRVDSPQSEKTSTLKRKKKPVIKLPQPKKQYNSSKTSKISDIYDFEETQDNSDVFTRPDFRSFRNNSEKGRKVDKQVDSDNDSQDYNDAISVDAFSSSTSSFSELLPNLVKSKSEQNITKKKCMIMGRIFKNAAKSRIIDENIRNIPIIDNTKLVEDFVLSCPEPTVENVEKSKMTEEEMNIAFDKLVNGDSNELKQATTESGSSNDKNGSKNNSNRKKSKAKSKKRGHGHSDSSDDEFKLQKYPRKRIKKKNNGTEDSCINLEQELKECIGVASRKSQRKCTSGKQNVLIEYWSSDESLFEPEVETTSLEKVAIVNNDCHNKELAIKSVECPKFDDNKTNFEDIERFDTTCEDITKCIEKPLQKKVRSSSSTYSSSRRKRATVNPLYHWSSSSEDESRDLIEVKPLRDEIDDDEDRPVQHGWIVGDSPKKLVTMLAQAKGKKCEVDSVKEYGKKRTNTFS